MTNAEVSKGSFIAMNGTVIMDIGLCAVIVIRIVHIV